MARLLARGELEITNHDAPPDAQSEALAAFGLRLDQDGGKADFFYLWPEHVSTLELWFRVQTQWRFGMAGPTGLDYAGVESAMRLLSLPLRKRRALFNNLRTMERATLHEWAARR